MIQYRVRVTVKDENFKVIEDYQLQDKDTGGIKVYMERQQAKEDMASVLEHWNSLSNVAMATGEVEVSVR